MKETPHATSHTPADKLPEAADRSPHLSGSFVFDPTDRIYETHFPSQPVVPGSVIIEAFMRAARQMGFARVRTLKNFRFKEFVAPGTYSFTLRSDSGRLHCSLYSSGKTIATGILES